MPPEIPPVPQACGPTFCPAFLRILWPETAVQINAIAAMSGVTAPTVWRRVQIIGIEDQRPKRRKPRYTRAQFAALWADDGLSLAEIGLRLGGMHPVNVGEHGKRLGLPPRKTGAKPTAVIGPEFDEMWQLGVKTREMARFYRLSQPRITRIAADRGLALRIPPTPPGRMTLAGYAEWKLGQAMARTAAETEAVLKLAEMVDAPARIVKQTMARAA